jgi:dihydrofolate synthase / folylpolyglutamate synthase
MATTGQMLGSATILARLEQNYHRGIELQLTPAYRSLLEKLGNPHQHLPPVLHVAGTNGKGSTCAFARAILEAAGYSVHVNTSPHLVTFHERIRIAGKLIDENKLVEILLRCEALITPGTVSVFEIVTAAALVAFAEHPADACILEVGMGGRLDATNVVAQPASTAISRISYDHCQHLGNTLPAIAAEKAGIIKTGVPCFTMPQPDPDVVTVFRRVAQEKGAPLHCGDEDWQTEILPDDGFRYRSQGRMLELPQPNLPGEHQILNAGLAVAALSAMPLTIPETAIRQGLQQAEWPARLQRLRHGPLVNLLPPGWELWLDGGHNDSAGEVLAAMAATWHQQDQGAKQLQLVFGMLNTKQPREFLQPLATYIGQLQAVAIPDTLNSLNAAMAANAALQCGIKATAAVDVTAALRALIAANPVPTRVLICGSLYLAGVILRDHG